ncbi:MAG: putative bifunctional diguanylate cyclase/phosphodiesterase, partial [Woeseiaceae bacterium]
IVSPFLAIVVVLVWVAIASIDILAAGRAYVEGESLWSKNQKEAVSHLLRFADTRSESDFRSYQTAMMAPRGFRRARLELEKPRPDYAVVRSGFLEGGTHADDIPGVIRLYQRFHGVSYMKRVLNIWRLGDEFMARLDAAAEELHAFHASGRVSPSGRDAILNSIIQINRELRPWQNGFSNTLGEATRWIQGTLLVVILTVAGILIPVGIFLTQRMVSRVDQAERELKDLRLRQEYAAKLAYHASHDPLTNLVNRLEFENRLRLALHTAATQERQHVVMYLDLDQFKIVNDTSGHAAGDQLLRQVSALLKEQVREGDTLARLGGDEFGVLLENCPMQEAIRIADDLRLCIADFRFVTEGGSFSVGVSIGVVQVADGMLTLTDVLSAADAACYMAKDKGRNRVQFYRPHDSEISLRRGEMEWVTRLQRALEEGRFTLYAQRIHPIGGQDSRGAHHELLLRMLDEHGAIVPPMAFIPAAERYGMMPMIDQWVIENAFARISSLGSDGGNFAINISGTSIGDERFLEFVREQFRRYAMRPRSICFELTETAAVANFDKAARFFGEMKSLGCLFSLDDFGAGMSSFGYLRHLPVDFIKIDGSFVKDMADDPVDLATVRAINDVGHVMGKQTIAEFVDGETTLASLREIGVDFAQGNWMSAPAPFQAQAAEPRRRARARTSPAPLALVVPT